MALQVLDHMLGQQEVPSAMHVGSALHALLKEKGEAFWGENGGAGQELWPQATGVMRV